MASGRERYDRQIRADELKKGDQLHLTFMGGDEYCTVIDVRQAEDGSFEWEADSWAVIKDDVSPETKVWIKR